MYEAFPSTMDPGRGIVAKEMATGGFVGLFDCMSLDIAKKEAGRLERNYQVGETVKAVFPPNSTGSHRYFDGDQSLLFEAD